MISISPLINPSFHYTPAISKNQLWKVWKRRRTAGIQFVPEAQRQSGVAGGGRGGYNKEEQHRKGRDETVREEHWAAYLDCVGELLASPQVQAMKDIRHHPGVSCFEHSLFVSYVAFRLARRWGRDGRAAARAGLLHDLYLYDRRSLPSYKQCFAHPLAAERNARALCGELSREEENSILAHMWPMARSAPRSRTAAAVCLADKLCATAEVLGVWRRTALYRTACLPRPAFGGNAVKKR